MARQNVLQSNFTSGEVSPRVAGRLDTKIYANGLRTCENFIVLPQGGVTRRGGTQYVSAKWDHTTTARFFPFNYSDIQGYVLEFGAGYIHFHRNGGRLFEETNQQIENFNNLTDNGGLLQVQPSALGDLPFWDIYSWAGVAVPGPRDTAVITTTIPHTMRVGVKVWVTGTGDGNVDAQELQVVSIQSRYVFTIDCGGGVGAGGVSPGAKFYSTGLLAGDRFYISGADDYPELSNKFHIVKSVDTYDKWTIANVDYNSTEVTVRGSPNNEEAYAIPIEVVSPYSVADLNEIEVRQSADVLYIFHPDHAPMKLTRLDDDGDRGDWLLSEVNWIDGPYLPQNDSAPNVDTTTPANGSRYDDVYLEVSGYSHTATVTAAVAFTASADSAKSITNITNAAGLFRITSNGHGYANGDGVRISGVGSLPDGDWVVVNSAANTFDLTGSTYSAPSATTGSVIRLYASGSDDNGDKYLEYRQGDQWRLAKVQAGGVGTTLTQATVDIIENVLLYLDSANQFKNTPNRRQAVPGSTNNSNEVNYGNARNGQGAAVVRYQRIDPNNQLVSGDLAAAAGTVTSQMSNTFGASDIGKYIRYHDNSNPPGYHWAQIVKLGVSTTNPGASVKHAAAVTMVSNNATGNFVITGETRTGTVKAYRNGSTFALFNASSPSTDIGRHIRLSWGGRWVWGKITAVTSSSQVSVTFYEDMPRDPHDARKLAGSLDGTLGTASTTGRTYVWRLGAWSGTTGYPSHACFHEQRLMIGRTDTQPATFWGSITGDFERMSPTDLDGTVLDDSAIDFTLASGRVNAIKWMESGTNLVIGTNGGEWLARSSSATQEPITPTNITVTEQTRHGSGRYAAPLRIGAAIVFVNRSEQKVNEVAYLFSEDRLQDRELSIASEHILRQGGTVVQTAFQQNPHGVGWFLLSDGTLVGLTLNEYQEVIGWHRHEIGGGGVVESICVIPNSDGTADNLYMLVKRTYSGNTYRTIEMLTEDFEASGSSRTGMTFLDGCRVINDFSMSNLTKITGLNNLYGQTVTVTGNGTLVGTYTVDSSGEITLGTNNYTEIVVGCAYTSTLKSLPPEGGSVHGTSAGMKKTIKEIKARVHESIGLKHGREGALLDFDFSTLKEDSETTLPFFSGTAPLVPNMPHRTDCPWVIACSNPYPLTVLSVALVIETNQ